MVRAVARACPDLIHVNLAGMATLSDFGLGELLAGCPLLQVLHVSQCRNITDHGLAGLFPPSHFGQALQVLALTDTSVTQEACVKLVEHFPFLQIHLGSLFFLPSSTPLS